jgi:Tripartite tricarboxylate transporter TctB family
MTEPREKDRAAKRALGAELVIPVTALVFTLYYFLTIVDAPWTAQASAFFIGSILIGLVLIFIATAVRAVTRGEGDWGFRVLFEPYPYLRRRAWLLALTIVYVVVIPYLGFTIVTFAFLVLAISLLNRGKRIGLTLAIATTLSLGGYFLFIVAFQSSFPEGPFEVMMQGIL